MVDTPELIEESELQIWDIIEAMQKHGVRYQVIHWLIENIIRELEAKAIAENWLDQEH